MKRYIIFALFAGITLSACEVDHRKNLTTNAWPLENGNLWVYGGVCNGRQERSATIVVRFIERGAMRLYILKGFPDDLLEGVDWEPSEWGILQVGHNRYYRIAENRVDSVENRLSNPADALTGLVQESELMLQLPLEAGFAFGETFQLTRPDSMYAWYVTEKTNFDPTPLKIMEFKTPVEQFTLRYATVPDETLIDFVPGIGITRYRYKHNGTPDNVDLKLTTVRFAGTNGTKPFAAAP